METQITAEDVIVALVESMRQSLEPLLFTTWAPGLYHVYLRQRDFERLKGIFPAIIEEAKIALDQEIDHLNESATPSGLLAFLPWFKKEPAKQYLKPKEDWNISFSIDDDLPETEKYRVEVLLVLPPSPEYGPGNQTIRVTTNKGAGGMTTKRTTESSTDQPPNPPAERALANITYEDQRGEQTYTMKKDQIAVGRGGVDYWVDLKLDTKPDVSHEHLRLRYDKRTSQFFIKDMSTFGTTVNGVAVQSSVEVAGGAKRDKDIWVPLPPKARIGLAGVLFLDFEAVKEK